MFIITPVLYILLLVSSFHRPMPLELFRHAAILGNRFDIENQSIVFVLFLVQYRTLQKPFRLQFWHRSTLPTMYWKVVYIETIS